MAQVAQIIERRKLRRDARQNRERILRSARELFNEYGLVVGLHDVARHAELGPGTVYRHFPNHDALVAALYDESTDHMEQVAREAAEVKDPWDAFVQFFERSHEIRSTDRGIWAVAQHSARNTDAGFARHWKVVPKIVNRARAAKRLRDDFDVTDIMVLNVMIAAGADFTNDIDPELWRRYLAIMLDGLRAQRRSSTPLPRRAPTKTQIRQAMLGWYDAAGRWGPQHRPVRHQKPRANDVVDDSDT